LPCSFYERANLGALDFGNFAAICRKQVD